jgi:hypothetical protein
MCVHVARGERPAVSQCWIKLTATRAGVLRKLAGEATAGAISPQTLQFANDAQWLMPRPPKPLPHPSAPKVSVTVDPLSGSGAKIERGIDGTSLTYTDAGRVQLWYTVVRPKFAQGGLVNGDLGGWIYVAPDHKSGLMFNIAARGQVSGKAMNPIMMQMMVGQ